MIFFPEGRNRRPIHFPPPPGHAPTPPLCSFLQGGRARGVPTKNKKKRPRYTAALPHFPLHSPQTTPPRSRIPVCLSQVGETFPLPPLQTLPKNGVWVTIPYSVCLWGAFSHPITKRGSFSNTNVSPDSRDFCEGPFEYFVSRLRTGGPLRSQGTPSHFHHGVRLLGTAGIYISRNPGSFFLRTVLLFTHDYGFFPFPIFTYLHTLSPFESTSPEPSSCCSPSLYVLLNSSFVQSFPAL